MSIQKRKIGYWSIDFLTSTGNYFDEIIFCRFMDYLQGLTPQQSLTKEEARFKAISLEKINKKNVDGRTIYEIILKSCKYNHSPDYMSSIDGSERPSDKQLSEGEKELTHICMLVDDKEAFTIFEERKSGVTVPNTIKYFNYLLEGFISKADDLADDFKLWASVIPSEEFIAALEKTYKISCAELYVENKVTGSGYLNLLDLHDTAQKDIILTVKAKRNGTLGKEAIKTMYNRLTTGETVLDRVRVKGKDINKMSITLDSLDGKKVEEITVDLLENGIVDSSSLFSKMEELLSDRK